VFDIEADKHGKTTIVGYMDVDGFVSFPTEKELLEHIFCYVDPGTVIYAHNFGGYDGQRLLPYLDSFNAKFAFRTNGGRITAGKIKEAWIDNICFKGPWLFADSLLTIQMSLEKMAEMLGIEGKQGHHTDTDEKLIKYVERDCLILYKAIEGLQEAAGKLKFQLKPTPAACSADYVRRHIETVQLPDCSEDKAAYFGGMCSVIRPEASKGICYDINSAYTWAMCQPLPVGNPRILYIEGRKLREAFKNGLLGIAEGKVDIPDQILPPLPVRTDRIYYPWGRFSGSWTLTDLSHCEPSWLLGTWKIRAYRAEKWLAPVLEPLYEERQKSNGVLKEIIKKLLNGFYGKTAEIGKGESISEIDDISEIKDDTNVVKVFAGDCVTFLERKKEEYRTLAQSWATAAHITAGCRYVWRKHFADYLDRLCYFDTDSAYLTGDDDLPSDRLELGHIKAEFSWADGLFQAPKLYCVQEAGGGWHIRAKGFHIGQYFRVTPCRLYRADKSERGKPGVLSVETDGDILFRELVGGKPYVYQSPRSFARSEEVGVFREEMRTVSATPGNGRLWSPGDRCTRPVRIYEK